jgi:flagellar hook-associated protein 3 FlgL
MSNNMMTYNYLTSLNQVNYQQRKAMEQIYTPHGRLPRPSANPVDTVLDMRYKINLALNEQYTTNNDSAMSWMDTTHDTIDGITSIVHRVRELIIEAAKPSPQIAHDAIAEEIDGLIGQIMESGNASLGDRHIFAGQADREEAPFFLQPGDYTNPLAPAPPDRIVYSGDDHKISMVIDAGSVNTSYDSVNITGRELFTSLEADGTQRDLFADLIELRDRLRMGENNGPNANSGLAIYLSGDALENLAHNEDNILAKQSFLSAKASMRQLSHDLLKKSNVLINENISQMEDVNIADASIEFNLALTAFNAALSMGARILPMSLVDFLR